MQADAHGHHPYAHMYVFVVRATMPRRRESVQVHLTAAVNTGEGPRWFCAGKPSANRHAPIPLGRCGISAYCFATAQLEPLWMLCVRVVCAAWQIEPCTPLHLRLLGSY
jgi:hypothetical protein